ncbi:MAG: hypothetical protein KAW39_03080 [Thermoplasmata archaeon]|nr:hypothetical protein [Thermoplasmata archaeon]
MSKTDAFIKNQLRCVKTPSGLKRRVFIDASRQDQRLWVEGGLTFGFGEHKYGSCDFAWYIENQWTDPYSGRTCMAKPIIVVEGTDCLNTRSWGNAQIQRFHHVYGAALCGVTGVYYLNKGEHTIRPYLFAAAYYGTQHLRKTNENSNYLVLDDLQDIEELVASAADFGVDSGKYKRTCDNILSAMLNRFNETFADRFNGDWTKYLESRGIYQTPSGWIRILGPQKENFTNPSKRMGHIVIGEALTSHFLLLGSGTLVEEEEFTYLLPQMTKGDVSTLDSRMSRDKEWALLRKDDNPWRVVALDELEGISDDVISAYDFLKGKNRNKFRKQKNDADRALVSELKSGEASIPSKAGRRPQLTRVSDYWL